MSMLKLGDDIVAKQIAPIKAGLTKGFLSKVSITEVDIKKGEHKGDKQNCIEFVFKQLDDPEREYRHLEWPLEQPGVDASEKAKTDFAEGFKNVAARIKHIILAYRPKFTEKDIPESANFDEFYKNISDYFNGITYQEVEQGEGKNKTKVKTAVQGQAIYTNKAGEYIPVWLKIVYIKDNIRFPYRPNFIEKVVEGVDTKLTWNPNYDKDVPQARDEKSSAPSKGGIPIPKFNADEDDAPSWGE